jgi:NAD-reducing hydrogenase small subunit
MPKLKVATTSLAGCFGCHMSILDIDERLFPLLDLIEFDRSPLTDIKHCGPCDIGIVEGGLCNAENVHVLREFRANCKTLIAIGACAVTGGLPAQRNHLDLSACLSEVYLTEPGLENGLIPNDPELPFAPGQGAPPARGGEGGLLHPRLPALGGRHLEIPHRPHRRAHAQAGARVDQIRLMRCALNGMYLAMQRVEKSPLAPLCEGGNGLSGAHTTPPFVKGGQGGI